MPNIYVIGETGELWVAEGSNLAEEIAAPRAADNDQHGRFRAEAVQSLAERVFLAWNSTNRARSTLPAA